MATHQQDFALNGLVETDQAQSSGKGSAQCAEDNPRASESGTSLARPARVDTTEIPMPVVNLDGIPQLLSQSWARRNARAKRLSQCIPGPLRGLLNIILILLVLAYVLPSGFTIISDIVQDGMHWP